MVSAKPSPIFWIIVDIKIGSPGFGVLSENSIHSDWVADEVEETIKEEANREKKSGKKVKILILFRIDNTALNTDVPWVRHLKRKRNIGDFLKWKDIDIYQTCFKRLLEHLRTEPKENPE